MIASNYVRSVCCGLLMLAVAGRASAYEWWAFSVGGIGVFALGSIAGSIFCETFDKKKPVRVGYPDPELYKVDAASLKDAAVMKLRREKRKLANLVNLMMNLEKNFVGCVNERSSGVRRIQEMLKNELNSEASDDDVKDLKDFAKKHIDNDDGDQKVALFIETYREMQKQVDKVKDLTEKYKDENPGA